MKGFGLTLILSIVLLPLLISVCGEAAKKENARTQEVPEKAVKETFWKEIDMKVEGMTCTGCEETIESALTKLDGVKEAKANYIEGDVKVVFDSTKVDIDRLVNAVNESGYKAFKPEAIQEEK